MLTDLPSYVLRNDDPVNAILNPGRAIQRVGKGLYLAHVNFDHTLDYSGILKNRYPFSPWMDFSLTTEQRLQMVMDELDGPQDYGVCDYPKQVVERWPQLESDPRRLVVSFAEMRKDEQPADGGWRWHKWGEYSGTQEPTTEYLYDEPIIESVYCFHVHEVEV